MSKKMQCMIRMDDITADMDWGNFNRVREIFDKYQIFPLLGVVPDNKDSKLSIQEKKEDFWEILCSLQKQGWSIAQHGTYHQYVTTDSGILGLKNASEFAGLSYEEQFAKLENGKRILESKGIYSDVFMAPGHTYDRNTVKALYNLGFRTITDGLYTKPYCFENILFVPCRLQGYRNVKGIDTICLHSNVMTDADIRELEVFCQKNCANIIPFQPEKIKQKAVKRTAIVILTEKRALFVRVLKNRVANSKRLKWYMQYTHDKNCKRKWIKRVCYLPLLLIGREK